MLGKTVIVGAIAALSVTGCVTTNSAATQGEIVTVQYDPDDYSQTNNTADAIQQCRAKGYADAVPHRQQPNMSRSTWGYQTFICLG